VHSHYSPRKRAFDLAMANLSRGALICPYALIYFRNLRNQLTTTQKTLKLLGCTRPGKSQNISNIIMNRLDPLSREDVTLRTPKRHLVGFSFRL
jgi:hypothetical protein